MKPAALVGRAASRISKLSGSGSDRQPQKGFGGSSEVEARPAFPFRSDHPLKSCWDAVLVLLAIFVIFAAPIELGFHEDVVGEGWVATTTLTADVLFCLDVPLRAHQIDAVVHEPLKVDFCCVDEGAVEEEMDGCHEDTKGNKVQMHYRS